MTEVLITGGGGFIGSHLVDSQLARGYLVRTVDLHVERLAHTANLPGLDVVVGDLLDPELVARLVEGVDLVYHLASAHLDVSLPDDHYWRVNVDATLGLLRAARTAGVSRVVHCSSVGVIGDVKNPPADEHAPCHPTNIYEKTKLAGEQAALQYAAETGFPVVVARPAWVYGPRCPRTEKLFRTIARRRFPFFGDGSTLRHPVYVSDAVRGLELCAEAIGVTGQIYILAGDEPVTIKTLVGMIAQVLDVRPPALHLPVALGKAGGHALELAFGPLGRQPPFSRRSLDFFLKDNAYDIGKARRDLRFKPQVDLHSGLVETLHWLNHCKNGPTQSHQVDGTENE
jgi:nucleoside-diphosphate-sugar epimerase